VRTSSLAVAVIALRILFGDVHAATLFDFDNAPVHVSLPLDQTVDGITAHFGATGQGFSIQPADTLGFTPQGFAGNCIYPNSIFKADLLISFDTLLSGISLLYSPQELGTDSSCTMRLTAMNGSTVVGQVDYSIPGDVFTWPVGTLTISPSQAFDNVIVHYQAPPPTGGDYGTIFLVDNVTVTPAVPEPSTGCLGFGGLALFGGRSRRRASK
jgi:hypothetical protein